MSSSRAEIARALMARLEHAVPGSRALLRGSLAGGTADAYSDVDLLWLVPDGMLEAAVASVDAAARASAGPVLWVRADPDLARCPRRRLLAVRHADLPLFWRVDLDVRETGVAADDRYGLDEPAWRAQRWPRAASACENAIAAVKALRRGDPGTARELLVRGHDRIASDAVVPPDAALGERDALTLARACELSDPALAPLVAKLVREVG